MKTKTKYPFHSTRTHWATALLVAATAVGLTLNAHAAGKSQVVATKAVIDDFHFLTGEPNRLVSDGNGAYTDGVDLVSSVVGRARGFNINLNTSVGTPKPKPSKRFFKFQNGFPLVPNGSCADLRGTVCEPVLDVPLVCETGLPQLPPTMLADWSFLRTYGGGFAEAPVGCESHGNFPLHITVAGQTFTVFFGNKAPSPGCASCITVRRMANANGKAVWKFFTQPPHIGYLFQGGDVSAGHFVGMVQLPFSGMMTSINDEPEPDATNPCPHECACGDPTLPPTDPLGDRDVDGYANFCDAYPDDPTRH